MTRFDWTISVRAREWPDDPDEEPRVIQQSWMLDDLEQRAIVDESDGYLARRMIMEMFANIKKVANP